MKRNVEFNSKGYKVRGVLVTPETGKGPFPIAVMGGGWCYVKEIVLPHYAQAILNAGVAVLMFDYRGLGESEGEARQHIARHVGVLTHAAETRSTSAAHYAPPRLRQRRNAVGSISTSANATSRIGSPL